MIEFFERLTMPLLSLTLMLAGFAMGLKFDEDRDIAMEEMKSIKTWSLWAAVFCFIASFCVLYFFC